MSGVLAIIPARGGSKRFPGKNLALFSGEPLILHTIRQALESSSISRVIVSTDSTAIGEVAEKGGAEVILRPESISVDNSPSEAALLHVLKELHDAQAYQPAITVFLQCTSPVRRPGDIDAAIELLHREGVDSVFSVVERSIFLWARTDNGLKCLSYNPQRRPRSQDLSPFLIENGSIYVMRTAAFIAARNRLCSRFAPFVMDPLSAIDIDEPEDLEIAELNLKRTKSSFSGGEEI